MSIPSSLAHGRAKHVALDGASLATSGSSAAHGPHVEGGPVEVAIPGAVLHADAELTVRRTPSSHVGDLSAADVAVDTDFGSCRYTSLAGAGYQVRWGSYGYRSGLWHAEEADETALALLAQLAGSGDRSGSGAEAAHLRSGEVSLVVVPGGWRKGAVTRESRGSAFDLLLSRDYVLELAGRHPQLLDGVANRLVRRQPGTITARGSRITPRKWALIQRVRDLGAGVTDGSGSLVLEAAVLELLALQLDPGDRAASSERLRLSRADVDGIHAARDLLLDRLDDPPTLAELARHAVTNEFKLKRGFREIFGTSPYAYLLDHRLELARSWLLDTDWSIARISRRVGYREPAHFTNAFRRRYGVPPSALRRNLTTFEDAVE